MNTRDLLSIAIGSLQRMKLRTFLTVSGVIIAIAAFVGMLSFGAGMQQSISKDFDELGLLSTIQVFSSSNGDASDSTAARILDDETVGRLAQLPGVNLAYPLDAFQVTVSLADTQVNVSAQALSGAAAGTKFYSRLAAGTPFTSDDAREALVTSRLLERLGRVDPDSLVGKPVVVSAEIASLDSGLVHMFRDADPEGARRLMDVFLPGRGDRSEAKEILQAEMTSALQRFLNGYMRANAVVTDTLIVRGVLDDRMGGPWRIKPLLVPVRTARRLSPGDFGSSPANLFAYLNSGARIELGGEEGSRNYPHVTLNLDSRADPNVVADTLEAMGFRVFSYAREFREMRKFFLFFDMALGVVGFIALVIASLGIVNTLVTSIVERRREIGILKSLGADEGYIRVLFLVESGTIGALGSGIGIVFGWLITRVASVASRIYLNRQGLPDMDLFALPIWLILVGFFFGLGVSIAAGLYPAARAAAVDPVEALRSD